MPAQTNFVESRDVRNGVAGFETEEKLMIDVLSQTKLLA